MYYTTSCYTLHEIGLSLQGGPSYDMKLGMGEGAPPRLGRLAVASVCTVFYSKDINVKSKPCKATNTGQHSPVNTTPQDVVVL